MDCGNGWTFKENSDFFQFWYGLRGPAGPAGPPGSSVELRGPVASTSLLPESASSSELWMVGASSPYVGYFWNGTAWIEAGYILQGPQGEPGEDGVSPEIEIEPITGGHTVTITDAEHPSGQSFNVMDGADGAPGQPGTPGAPGAAAGFGTPTATVDGNVGTPSVTVTASGPDTAKVFSFAFSNLKGEPGSGGGGPDPYTSNPADLAASASPGTSSNYSRGDHVHKLPSASDIGAYVKPSGGIPASDLASGVIPSVPSAYTSNPEMDGTASPGSSGSWARGDHVHPSDTGKQDKITASGILKGNGSGGVSAAVAGTDYQGPLGITGASVDDFVKITAVDANGKPTAYGSGTPGGGGDVTADMLGIVINGNSTPVGASVGQYVIVKNSTISGITDGLYTAAQAIPASTAIDATYLSAVSGGGLNGVLSRTKWVALWENASPGSGFAGQPIAVDLSGYDTIKVLIKSSGTGVAAFYYDVPNTVGAYIATIIYSNTTGGGSSIMYNRRLTITNTGFNVDDAYGKVVGSTDTPNVVNTTCIPWFIYGGNLL